MSSQAHMKGVAELTSMPATTCECGKDITGVHGLHDLHKIIMQSLECILFLNGCQLGVSMPK